MSSLCRLVSFALIAVAAVRGQAVNPVILTQQDAVGNTAAVVQHSVPLLVSTQNPAQPGEVLTLFATGLGPTNPAVAPGTPAPSSPPAVTTSTPIVNLGCQALVVSSQLVPGAVGLYQVTFQVPGGIAGNQTLSLSIGRQTSNSVFLPVSGTASASSPPAISLVANAFGEAQVIAPNTWVEIKGTNLAPPGDTRIWLDSDFVNKRLPNQLDGVTATVNGKPAYVYYISPTQVNILTPPDPISGLVPVCVAVGGSPSSALMVQARAQSPSFFEFVSTAGNHYVYGRHLSDGSLIGPSGLFPSAPGITTPVKPGESIYVAGNGFGPTSVPVVSGAVTQGGTLPSPLPTIKIGGFQANVSFGGLIADGTYQFNLVVPKDVPDGDLALTASYNGLNIQSNLLITVQH